MSSRERIEKAARAYGWSIEQMHYNQGLFLRRKHQGISVFFRRGDEVQFAHEHVGSSPVQIKGGVKAVVERIEA